MANLLLYMIKVSIGTSLLYLCYLLFFNRDTFYMRNRIFLILVLLIPILLPAVKIPVITHDTVTTGTYESFDNLILPISSSRANLPAAAVRSFDFLKLALVIYFSISIILIIRFVISVLSTSRIIRNGSLKDARFPRVIVTDLKVSPFSFFPYVVIPADLAGNDNYKDVLSHEIAHVQQGHTFDLLLSEILIAVQWFNPLVWLVKRSMILNHEYLADHVSISNFMDVKEYQLRLLRFNPSLEAVPLAHNFNSVVKNRIIMINKKPSSRLSAMKNLVILPFVVFVTYISATPEYKYESSPSNSRYIVQEGNQAKGIVLGEDGKPLMLVHIVMVSNTPGHVGVQTGSDGHFLIKNLVKDATLEFSCIGYKTQVLKPDLTSDMVVKMVKDPNYKITVATMDWKAYHDGPNVRIVLNQKDAIIVVDDKVTSNKGEITLLRDDIAAAKMLKGTEATAKYGEKGKNGAYEIVTKKYAAETGFKIPEIPMSIDQTFNEPAYQGQNADAPLNRVDEMPEYPGGEKALLDFIRNNIKYPKEALAEKIEGKVIVRFIVTKEGKSESISVLKGINPAIDAEAIRVIGLIKNWKPGKLNGKVVNVWYMIPVTFELPKSNK